METQGIDPAGTPWVHVVGEKRRQYLWHWTSAEVAALAGELIKELQERGVILEVALAEHVDAARRLAPHHD